jgi:hypothetical protein
VTHELPVTPSVAHLRAEPPAPPPGAELPHPTDSQVQAADSVFSRSDESHLVMGLMGMQAGIILLKDLAVEHFSTSGRGGEEENRPRPRPAPDDPSR